MKRRTCRKCGRRRYLKFFAKNKGSKDGHIHTCKDCHRKYTQKHYERNKLVYKERAASWYHENHEVAKAAKLKAARRFREKHPEKARASSRAYKKANPQKCAEYENRRRARKMHTQVEPVDRREIYERDNGCCHLCGNPVTFRAMELDHVIPLSRGGTHTKNNLKVAHAICNRRKWANIA